MVVLLASPVESIGFIEITRDAVTAARLSGGVDLLTSSMPIRAADLTQDLARLVRGRHDNVGQPTKEHDLNADDDQQSTEQQQRPVANSDATEPQDGEVGVDSQPHQAEHDANRAEEVCGAASKRDQVQRREKVERRPNEAFVAVF